MSRITNDVAGAKTRAAHESPGREYRSELRARQAEDTRVRILDAAVRVIAAGIATLSIPAVAREAGVSVPTVYRHFGTKQDLLAAVYPHIVRRAGLDQIVMPRTMEELRDGVRTLFNHLDAFDDLARAAMASPAVFRDSSAVREVRQSTMANRVAMTRQLADMVGPDLPDADRERIARLLLIVTSSAALRTWRDNLGLSAEDVADEIDWVIRSVAAGSITRNAT
jgi:AcrR family transcriptional regulator